MVWLNHEKYITYFNNSTCLAFKTTPQGYYKDKWNSAVSA